MGSRGASVNDVRGRSGAPVQVVGSLVQECVILSDKLSPDQLGTWLLHHHFFGQLEISAGGTDETYINRYSKASWETE